MAHEIRLSDGLVFHTSPGASSGVEGAWFINNYVGVGGKAVASHVPTQLQRDASLASYLTNPNTAITENGMDFISASVGAYFDCALTYRLSLGGKLLAGYAFSDAQTIYLTPDNGETVTPFLKLKEMHAPDFQTGLSISYWAKLKLGFRLFFDYSITPTRYRYYFADKPDAINRVNKNLSFFLNGDYQTGSYVHSFDRQFRFSKGLKDPSIPEQALEGISQAQAWLDFTNFFVEKADFLKIRNIGVTYTVNPRKLLKKITLGFNVYNPLSFTASSVDPDASLSGALSQGAVATGGINYSTYSTPRQYIGTIRINF